MKKLVIPMLFFSLACINSCDDYHPPFDVAEITGFDLRLCPCCGGYFIDIDDEIFRFYTIPPGSNIDLPNETYPVKVLVEWKASDFQCLGDEIDLLTLVKLQ